jgi:hypothetical protein
MAALYRHYDKDGVLLYVCVSLNAISRPGQHNGRAPWFFSITRVEVQRFESRAAARFAETEAIVRESPKFNVLGTAATRTKTRTSTRIVAAGDRKRRGRPTLYEGREGKGAPLIGIRLPPDEIAAIDCGIERQKETLSRPVAIRRLVEMALENTKKSGKGGR